MSHMNKKYCAALSFIAIASLTAFQSYAADSIGTLDSAVQDILNKHVATYQEQEYFSGASVSYLLPKQPIKNFYAGRVSHDPNSKNVSATTLFHIGSISKSFTAAMMLQLEKEGKVNLNDSLGTWLPNYSKWSAIKLTTLLNMTSGLPNYSETPLWNTKEYQDISRRWTERELIDFVYPKKFNPPIKSGYFYTNTGYILAGMILEKAGNHSFQSAIVERLFKPADLQNTFYPVPKMDKSIQARLSHAYNFNQYDNPSLVGRDVYSNNLSWGGAAGGVVSTSEDVIKWVKALFVDSTILDASQKNKMMQLVSTETGKPITQTTKNDPQGFGLGVIEAYREGLGRYWFYEGQTLGFRALYLYKPCNGVIISAIFNSATNSQNDHAGPLLQQVYTALMTKHPELACNDTD